VHTLEGVETALRWLKPIICRVLDEADDKEREDEEEDQVEELANEEANIWQPEPPLELFASARRATMTLLEEDDEEFHEFSRGESVESTPLSQQSLLGPGSTTPKARTRGWGSAPASSTQRVVAPQDQPFHHAGEPARKASSVSNPSALKFRKDGGPSTIAPTTTAPSFSIPLVPPYSHNRKWVPGPIQSTRRPKTY
jgi:hypothetical protein